MINLEKLNDYKEKSNLTLDKIAEIANKPKSTVSKIFSGETQNPGIDSLAPIIIAIGGSLDEICGIEKPSGDLIDKSGSVNMTLLDMVFKEHTKHIAQLVAHTNEIRRWFKASVGLNVAFLALIVFVVIFDITHPTMGYVQYTVQAVSSVFQQIMDLISL